MTEEIDRLRAENARLKTYHLPDCNAILDDESDAVLHDFQTCSCEMEPLVALRAERDRFAFEVREWKSKVGKTKNALRLADIRKEGLAQKLSASERAAAALKEALDCFIQGYTDEWPGLLHEEGCPGVRIPPEERDEEWPCRCDGDDRTEIVKAALATDVGRNYVRACEHGCRAIAHKFSCPHATPKADPDRAAAEAWARNDQENDARRYERARQIIRERQVWNAALDAAAALGADADDKDREVDISPYRIRALRKMEGS